MMTYSYFFFFLPQFHEYYLLKLGCLSKRKVISRRNSNPPLYIAWLLELQFLKVNALYEIGNAMTQTQTSNFLFIIKHSIHVAKDKHRSRKDSGRTSGARSTDTKYYYCRMHNSLSPFVLIHTLGPV